MNYKFAVFDLDGTLVESMKYWRGLPFAFLYEKYGLKNFPEEEIESVIFSNLNYNESFRYLNQKYGYPKMRIYQQDIFDMMYKFYSTVIDIKPYVREFLDKLKNEGVKCAIATATPRRESSRVLERLGLSEYFEFILTVDEVGKSKFFPDIFDKCLERFGAKKENTMVFEDALYSIKTLKANGYKVCGIEDYCEKEHDKVKELSDIYIVNYKELL
ncbi:MAG: HAD-IA family hydrolase [Clostridia bacterium]|nr:HAD-IA family hydrolase [Clostridia bacterium]